MEFVLLWFGITNILAFVLFSIDKLKAIKGAWRISEKTLLTIALVGGWIGAWLGMEIFNHKVKKGSFYIKYFLVVLIWIVVFLIFYLKLS